MNIRITPSSLQGHIVAPPSKSMAHRLLICGGLSAGESIIHGISRAEDVDATLDCLSALGAEYTRDGDSIRIRGTDVRTCCPRAPLFCRESGSTLRFFLPLCLLSGNEAVLRGAPRLFERPLSVYENIAADQGLTFLRTEESVTVGGRLRAGEYRIPGDISSQFISGLLFALPLLEEDSTVVLLPPVESRSYILLTIKALALFGVDIVWRDAHTLFVRGSQTYRASEQTAEGDWSNAAAFLALNLLGGEVTVGGLAENSLQGDRVCPDYFARLSDGTPTLSLADCPDLGPILMALAAAKHGAVLCDTRRLRLKESDRVAAMAEELAKFGASVTVQKDTVKVCPAAFHAPSEPLSGHGDHRVVMALCALLCKTGGELVGAEAVGKSLPRYFELLTALGARVEFFQE